MFIFKTTMGDLLSSQQVTVVSSARDLHRAGQPGASLGQPARCWALILKLGCVWYKENKSHGTFSWELPSGKRVGKGFLHSYRQVCNASGQVGKKWPPLGLLCLPQTLAAAQHLENQQGLYLDSSGYRRRLWF